MYIHIYQTVLQRIQLKAQDIIALCKSCSMQNRKCGLLLFFLVEEQNNAVQNVAEFTFLTHNYCSRNRTKLLIMKKQ